MQRADFSYQLPAGRIAMHPCPGRSDSRMLCIDPGNNLLRDALFKDFPDQLQAGDLVVFNDTRVIPARLLGSKESGGKVEVMVERVRSNTRVLAHVRASKSPKPGTRLCLEGALEAQVIGRDDDLFLLEFGGQEDVLKMLEQYGHMPLPPYIERADEQDDRERYQTIYASTPGAVAAPTAGLHFDATVMDRLAARGVKTAYVTLHVGAGTFQPVRADNLDEHVMHHEYFEVDASTCEQIAQTRRAGGRVVAVGTTVVRSLEAAAVDGLPEPCKGETDLFITPGYQFKVVDALLTNFHLSESTLLMLVCAFAGYRRTMDAYAHAIAAGYRFYSYGDAMFISARAEPGVPAELP
ncbi:MAG: tRNA preQ1(34) S-adenosylmethionine ribosyltransferase-isomerase QueA [Gammaproteobacteria bacterium]|nr:tRNA preQ1(34) S-adenosylmethionine ribosyltransferase-isomerase QueA [Gammaproteobacteria bacterium]